MFVNQTRNTMFHSSQLCLLYPRVVREKKKLYQYQKCKQQQSYDQKLKNYLNQAQQALIQLECDVCIIQQVSAQRNFGVVELALIHSQKIEIFDIKVSQSQRENRKLLHPSYNCIFDHLLPYVSFLIIAFYHEIQIDNLQIEKSQSFNYPIIQISGYDAGQNLINESIQIQNSYFYNNTIILGKTIMEVSIININSNQNSQVIIQNVTFVGNILHHYFQSLKLFSSTSILLNLKQGQVSIQDSLFMKNLASNSTNTNLFISSKSIHFQNVVFSHNNILLNSSINDRLFLESIQINMLEKYFPILSNGGNAYLIQNQLCILNITVISSLSSNGGSFYIKTNAEGKIMITNSLFINSKTSFFNTQNSKGGCLYIDSTYSELNFTLINSIINSSFSQSFGGSLYIIPSKLSNYIIINNISVQDSFSQQNSFLSLIYPSVQNTISNIYMENVRISQSKEGYEKFLFYIDNMGTAYKTPSIIYSNYGNMTLKNVFLINAYIQNFLKFEQAQVIQIQGLLIINNSYIDSPLIYISSSKNQISYISLTAIEISNVNLEIDSVMNKCETINNEEQLVNCPNIENSEQQFLKTKILHLDSILQNQCKLFNNKNLIFSSENSISSLIQIIVLGQYSQIIIKQSKFYKLICQSCDYGIIKVVFDSECKGNFELIEVKFEDNICGNHGCLSFVSLLDKNNYRNQDRLLSLEPKNQHQDQVRFFSLESNDEILEKIKLKNNHKLIIEKCVFKNNTAKLGGALFLNSTSALIGNSLFTSNNAEKGGCIYYTSNQMQLQLINAQFINNIAQIAGGLYLQQLGLGMTQLLNIQFFDNFGNQTNQDISENPTSLTVSLDGGKTFLNKKLIKDTTKEIIEIITLDQQFNDKFQQNQQYILLPSGIQLNQYSYFDESQYLHIPYNLTFRIIPLSQFQQPQTQLQDSFCIINHKIIDILSGKEIKNISSSISISNFTFNTTSQDFNGDDLIIYFNPKYSDSYFLRLIIECNAIFIPIFDSSETFSIINYNSNYQLYVDIQTFPCQIGEYLNPETGGCIYCDPQQNLYSLTKHSKNCTYKDNELINQFTSSTIQLRPYYWRAQNNSTKIEYCFHQEENCQGGWIPGDQSCALGHIGALCEQCDLYNVQGLGTYSISSQYSCGNCNKIFGNTLIIIIIYIWVFVSIFLSVNSSVQIVEQKILSLRLKFLGFSDSSQQASTAILVKLFTNYLQIITTIRSFELEIPKLFIGIYSGFGNPIVQMSYSWDCSIVHITNIDINYFRIIWSIINAFIILVLFIVFEWGKQFLFHIQLNNQHLYTAFLYMFIYMHPSIIEMLISQLSYREISNIKWIQGNVAYKYETETHKQWQLSLIMPLSLLFGLFIPLFLFQKIHSSRHQLSKSIVKKKWGYLINEYKKESYFWDILKVLQRQIIIIVFTYYEDFISVKSALAVVILFFYSLLSSSYQPYKAKKLNEIERATMKVCSTSIILGSCIYQAQQNKIEEIIWLFYCLITYLNAYLFIYYILKILKAYLSQFQKVILIFAQRILKIFPKFMIKHPIIQKLLLQNVQKRRKTQYYFSKIRKIILPQTRSYLNFKNSLQFSYSISPQIEILHQFASIDEKITTEKRIKQMLIGSLQYPRGVQSTKV